MESLENNKILNNYLKWDNTHLGVYDDNSIISKLEVDRVLYHVIKVNVNSRIGIIYCIIDIIKDLLPCIVEDIKKLFGVPIRGIHRIKISDNEYLLYNVSVTPQGKIVPDVQLSKLEIAHTLRKNSDFQRDVRKLITVNDILSLSNTNETNILIRKGINGSQIPMGTNEKMTEVSKGNEHSVIPKLMYSRWFGEQISVSSIVKEIVLMNTASSEDTTLVKTVAELRNSIEKIIIKYDANYIWYACFIIDKVSKHLLYQE